MSSLVNPIGLGALLAALYMLRFRAWRAPLRVCAYFAFFATLEWLAARHFLPPDALPDAIGWLCLALAVPVLIATWFVRRQELRVRETE